MEAPVAETMPHREARTITNFPVALALLAAAGR